MRFTPRTKTFTFHLSEIRALTKWAATESLSGDRAWWKCIHFDLPRGRVWCTDGLRCLMVAATPQGRPGQGEEGALRSLWREDLVEVLKGHRNGSTQVEIRFTKTKARVTITGPRGGTTEHEITVQNSEPKNRTPAMNIDRVWPAIEEDTESANGIAIRTDFLAALGDLSFCTTLKLYGRGQLDPVLFRGSLDEHKSATGQRRNAYWDALIMPMRT